MLKLLFKPIDNAVLIYFRFFAGVFLSLELLNSLTLGDFAEYSAPFHFTYLYFDWIRPLPFWGMIVLYVLTIISGFAVALGIHQRISAMILFLGYCALFLMEKAEYVNHLYLYCLVSFWLIFLPSKKDSNAWFYYLMLIHIAIVYFYAGIAKLDEEWLSGDTVGFMLGEGNTTFYTYGGLLFDLLIVPSLIWKRTRTLAFVSACIFHLMNAINFGLATFPWFSLMMTAMFFGCSWPRRFKWFDDFFPEFEGRSPHQINHWHKLGATALGVYVLAQLLLPFRHHLYPGRVSWTEDGHQFSWRMKLRSKSGDVFFYIMDKKSQKMKVILPQDYLTEKQYKDMIGKPDSILQFAHFLKEKFPHSSVYASSRISLNGKPKKEMINNYVDLALEKRKLGSYTWIRQDRPMTQINGGAGVSLR